MREILFRGKRQDNGEWIEGFYFQKRNPMWEDGLPIYHGISDLPPFGAEVDPETVGQYTGLTDKNGKKIFEGDIIVMSNQRNYPTLVKFCEFCWHLVIPNSYTYIDFRHRLENNPTKYEVIGNIHDNLELLKGGAI